MKLKIQQNIQSTFQKMNIGISASSLFFQLLLANGLLNFTQFINSMFLIKLCSPEAFGIYSLSISVAASISLIINSGVSYSLIRLLSKASIENNNEKLSAIVIGAAIIEVILLLLTSFIFIIFRSYLVRLLNVPKNESNILYFSLIAAWLIVITEFIKAIFQATNTKILIKYSLVYSFLRITVLPVLMLNKCVNTAWLMICIYVLPLFIMALTFSNHIRPLLKFDRSIMFTIVSTIPQIIDYSKWMGISSILYPQLSQLVVYMIASNQSPKSVGIFSAGLTFTAVFSLLNISIRQILLPYVSKITEISEINNYLKRILKVVPLYFSACLIVLTSCVVIMHLFFGTTYNESIPVFLIVGSATAIVIILGQVNLLSHTFYKPKINAYQAIGQFIFLLIGGIIITSIFPKSIFQITIYYAIVLIIGELCTSLYFVSFIKKMINSKIMY